MGEKRGKIRLLFLWHMHQPEYLNPETGNVELPWVIMHSCKGYLDMAVQLQMHPRIKATINFSGVLLKNLASPALPGGFNRFRNIALSKPSDLSYEERIFILKHFFSIAPQAIKQSPRMFQLLGTRGRKISEGVISDIHESYSDQDLMDIQVLFNLLWMGREAKRRFPFIVELEQKGSGFSQEEKEELLSIQSKIYSTVLEEYIKLASSGQIEISFTPYYHPILPLLLDSTCASEGLPGTALPDSFSFPDDAKWHVVKAVEEFNKVFKVKPSGMWPAEGGVSEKVISLISDMGIKWTATDEGILLRSLRYSKSGGSGRESLLYKPYKLKNYPIVIFFRDHYISDRIGFTYQSMDTTNAVEDLFCYLNRIMEVAEGEKPVVSIILDGENPWPYYPDDGWAFLNAIYDRLQSDERIETVTPSEILQEDYNFGTLDYLFPGSWIDANFKIWIGDHAKNRAWKLLLQVRETVAGSNCSEDKKKEAMEHIMVAEGSDWFWWYGEPNSSKEDPIFDQIFRSRLRCAMKCTGSAVPVALLQPPGVHIKPAAVVKSPLTFIHPGINGTGEKFFEWYNAGQFKIEGSGGEMAISSPLFSTIYYGFDYDFIYIRLDPLATPSSGVEERLAGVSLRIVFDEDTDKWIEISLNPPYPVLTNKAAGKEKCQVAFKRILEIAVPIRLFDFSRGSTICVFVIVMKNGFMVERYPREGGLEIIIPDENWDKKNWIV